MAEIWSMSNRQLDRISLAACYTWYCLHFKQRFQKDFKQIFKKNSKKISIFSNSKTTLAHHVWKYSYLIFEYIRIFGQPNIRSSEYSVYRIFGSTEYSNIRFKRIFGIRIFGCPNIRFNRILKYSVWPNIRLNRILEYSNHRIFGNRIFDSFEYRISNIKCRIRISTELFDIPNCDLWTCSNTLVQE